MNLYRVKSAMKLICLALLCLVLSATGLAETPIDPEAAIVILPGESIPNGINIKLLLRDKGYYSSNVPDEVFNNNALDDHTLNALGKLAEINPDKPAYNGSNRGMTQKALWDLQNAPQIIPSISEPTSMDYVDIDANTIGQSKTIEEIQKRLTNLNYLSRSDANYKPGEVSATLFAALKAFLTRNGVSELYDAQVITIAAQKKLLDTDPELLIPAEKKGFGGKLQAYFSGTQRILGLGIPMWVIWLVSVVLLALCVVLLINLVKNDTSDTTDAKKSRSMSLRRNAGKPVKFEITYGGATNVHEQMLDGLLKIGRNVGNFPLDLEDTAVSRRHCDLYFQNKKLMLHDYSSHGTKINGELINNTQRAINSGDVLEIGHHSIKVTY